MNDECLNLIMLYLSNNLLVKNNGKYKPLKMSKFNQSIPEFTCSEVNVNADILLQKKLIEVTDVKASPGHYNICKITAIGHEYIKTIKNDTFLNKFRKHATFENILAAISSGIGVMQYFEKFFS